MPLLCVGVLSCGGVLWLVVLRRSLLGLRFSWSCYGLRLSCLVLTAMSE